MQVVALYTFHALVHAHARFAINADAANFVGYWGDCEFNPDYNILSEEELMSYFDNGKPAIGTCFVCILVTSFSFLGRLVYLGPLTGDGGRFCYWRVHEGDLLRHSPVVWLDSEGGCQILAPSLSEMNAVQANQISGEILVGTFIHFSVLCHFYLLVFFFFFFFFFQMSFCHKLIF
jgi:hypothetical protein